jgi:hypothetical protein
MFRSKLKLKPSAAVSSLAFSVPMSIVFGFCPIAHDNAGGWASNESDAFQNVGDVYVPGVGFTSAGGDGWVEYCCNPLDYTFTGGMTSDISSQPFHEDCNWYWGRS